MSIRGVKWPSTHVVAFLRSIGLREGCGETIGAISGSHSSYSIMSHALGTGEGSVASVVRRSQLFSSANARRGLHASSLQSFASRGVDDGGAAEGGASDDGRRAKARMNKLLDSLGDVDNLEAREKAKVFLDGFFADGSMDGTSSSSSSSDDEADDLVVEGSEGDVEGMEEALHENTDVVLRELKGLRRGSRRVVLQRLLQGGILSADPTAAEALKKIERSFRPPPGFRMKVVHIARTSKGTRAGGFGRFSALVVVGNGEGVLGWGTGKAVEVANAVQKAQQSAYRNLYPIPRHHGHTITEEVTATFGKTKVIMYPKSSGRGIVANPMLADVCQLAGIYDIGVKVHGSRNPQNTIKCLFAAFDKLRSEDELAGYDEATGVVRVPVLTGRFGKMSMGV